LIKSLAWSTANRESFDVGPQQVLNPVISKVQSLSTTQKLKVSILSPIICLIYASIVNISFNSWSIKWAFTLILGSVSIMFPSLYSKQNNIITKTSTFSLNLMILVFGTYINIASIPWMFSKSYFYPAIPIVLSVFFWKYLVELLISDPGLIPRYYNTNPHDSQHRKTSLQSFFTDPNTSRHCTTCLIIKPLRAKHCKETDRCYARFDHYCPWIVNAVAVKNHGKFVAYLSIASLNISFAVFLGWCRSNCWWSNTALTMGIIVCIFTNALLATHVYQMIVTNLTTNDQILLSKQMKNGGDKNASKKQRLASFMYNFGWRRNALDLASPIDWSNVYSIRDLEALNMYASVRAKAKSSESTQSSQKSKSSQNIQQVINIIRLTTSIISKKWTRTFKYSREKVIPKIKSTVKEFVYAVFSKDFADALQPDFNEGSLPKFQKNAESRKFF